jgi:hypothetical protein
VFVGVGSCVLIQQTLGHKFNEFFKVIFNFEGSYEKRGLCMFVERFITFLLVFLCLWTNVFSWGLLFFVELFPLHMRKMGPLQPQIRSTLVDLHQ